MLVDMVCVVALLGTVAYVTQEDLVGPMLS